MTLYGIGLGPGDPELVTLKAARILKTCPIIFTVMSSNVTDSVSEGIVGGLEPEGKLVRLTFAMSNDREKRRRMIEDNARIIVEHLKEYGDCAYTTLGDALSYSTFGHVLPIVRAALPEAEIEIVPGITSWSTLAAETGVVLAENREILRIVPSFTADMADKVDFPKNSSTVLLKTYRTRKALLDRLEREEGVEVVYGENLTREGAFTTTSLGDIAGREENYLSLMLVKKKG